MKEEKELIMHAAVMADNGWIFIGKQHADCFHKLTNIGLKPYHNACGQGFVTNKGRFVFRDKAARIAFSADQIEKCTNLLFSEDLWHPEHDGVHDYDEIKGYIKRENKDD